MRTFIVRTQNAEDDDVLASIQGRENEIANYDLNAANYADMLAAPAIVALPTEWPPEFAQFKRATAEQVATADLSPADKDRLSLLLFRSHLQMLARTTVIERDKALAVYSALLKRLPAGTRRDSAILRMNAKP